MPLAPSFRRPRSLRRGQLRDAAARDLSIVAARLRGRTLPPGDDEPLAGPASRAAAVDRQRRVTRSGADLADEHRDLRYGGPVVLLRCEHTPAWIEADWEQRVGGLTVHRFPGRHNDMLFEPVLSQVADTITAAIGRHSVG
jgi:hypothetical protein